jgi:hypothetical protein
VGSKTVLLARPDARHESVPHTAGLRRQADLREFRTGFIEQAQLESCGFRCVDGKVRPTVTRRRPKRLGTPGFDQSANGCSRQISSL